MTTCEDCGQDFPTADMHHDDSGSYCEECREAYEAEQQRLYAPRSARAYDTRDAYETSDPKHPDWLDNILDAVVQ